MSQDLRYKYVSTNKVVGSGILLFFCSFLFSEEKLGENNLIREKIVLWRYF